MPYGKNSGFTPSGTPCSLFDDLFLAYGQDMNNGVVMGLPIELGLPFFGEFDEPLDDGKYREIPPHLDALSRKPPRAFLPYDDVAGNHGLSIK